MAQSIHQLCLLPSSAHPQDSTLLLANILVAAYCTLQKWQLFLIHSQPLHLSFSHPRADFIAILELLRAGWEALSAVQIACKILLGKEAKAKGASQNDTSQNEHRVSTQERALQLQDVPHGRKAALDIRKCHTHTAGFPRSAVLAKPQESAASGRDQWETSAGFQLFPFQMPHYTLKPLHDLKAGIQRACCKLSCEDCSDRQCFLPAAGIALNIVRSSSQTLVDK